MARERADEKAGTHRAIQYLEIRNGHARWLARHKKWRVGASERDDLRGGAAWGRARNKGGGDAQPARFAPPSSLSSEHPTQYRSSLSFIQRTRCGCSPCCFVHRLQYECRRRAVRSVG